MLKRFLTASALGLLLTACAGGPPPEPPAPPPLDPTGTWDILVAAEGMEIPGTMIIRGSPEAGFTGTVETEMGGATISDMTVDGQTVTFYIPDVDVDARLVFDGDTFTGQMDGAMGFATISGTRRQAGG